MTRLIPRTARKKCSHEPNSRNSFTRYQVTRTRPEKGDPILKEYRPAFQRKLPFRSSGKKDHTRPVGWPHRKAIEDRWIEQAFVPIECVEIHNSQIRVTPLRRPGTKTLGKVREESSFRSRPEKDLTRKGDLIANGQDQTPERCRKSLRFDRGQRKTRPGSVTSLRRLGAI